MTDSKEVKSGMFDFNKEKVERVLTVAVYVMVGIGTGYVANMVIKDSAKIAKLEGAVSWLTGVVKENHENIELIAETCSVAIV